MDISLRQIEHLLAVERHRHFGKAAEALNISQPALSRSIQTLERSIGATLFTRSRARVEPTETGLIAIRHANRITAATSELRSEIAAAAGQAGRRLAVVCGYYPAELTVPGALSETMNDYPGLQVTMEVADWPKALLLMERDVCDLAVVELSAQREAIELGVEVVNQQQVFFVVRRGHPLSKMKTPGLQEALSFPWACSRIPMRAAKLFGNGPFMAGRLDHDAGVFVPKIIVSSVSTALKLVAENDVVGIATLATAYPYLERRELELVRFRASWMQLNYGFIWHAQKPLSRVAKTFMARIREAERKAAAVERVLRRELGITAW